jgi:hypothetical protein
MADGKKEVILKIAQNNALPTLFVDATQIANREDGFFFVRFLSLAPEGDAIEQARIMMSGASVRAFVDGICGQLNYYPSPNSTGK